MLRLSNRSPWIRLECWLPRSIHRRYQVARNMLEDFGLDITTYAIWTEEAKDLPSLWCWADAKLPLIGKKRMDTLAMNAVVGQ